jgi:nicotinamidase-related amidase
MTVERTNPAASLLRPERTALLLIDLQERLLPAISGREKILANSILLLRLAALLRLPVVLTTQYRKGLGDLPAAIREAAPGVEPLDKVTFGCFWDEGFVSRLGELADRDQLLVAGVETHICVSQTVLGALEKSYVAHVLGDATGSRAEANHRIGLARMERAGALISSTEMAIYELMGRSDSPAFKEMLPHLK